MVRLERQMRHKEDLLRGVRLLPATASLLPKKVQRIRQERFLANAPVICSLMAFVGIGGPAQALKCEDKAARLNLISRAGSARGPR